MSGFFAKLLVTCVTKYFTFKHSSGGGCFCFEEVQPDFWYPVRLFC